MGWSAGSGGYDYTDNADVLKKPAADFAADAGSNYQGAASQGLPAPVGKTLHSDSPTPLVVAIDVTGSMGAWPGIIFHKLPVLYHEAKLWLPEVEISFAAVGDAYCDRHPVQVCDFGKDRDLEQHINSLFPEGGGGGQSQESYELFAYYYLHHCDIPRAQKALFVYCGDEGFYEKIRRQQLQTLFGDNRQKDLDAYRVFAKLCKKFEVYNLRVTYNDPNQDAVIRAQWQKAIGAQRVLRLEDPRRIVDCILGLTALVANDYEQFRDRLAKRQTSEQVDQVVQTLHPLLPTTRPRRPVKAILTVPPYAPYVEKAVASPVVEGVRLNTIMPVSHDLRLLLGKLRQRVAPHPLWIDLKGRQLRVAAAAYVPFHHVELSHEIEVRTPVQALFNSGEAVATVRSVEGNKLILEDIPPMPLGAGMSVHLLDPSLRIKGYLTERDCSYVTAAAAVGVHHYMLSYVENSQDLEDLLALDPRAEVLAKIESEKGLNWAAREYPRYAGRVHLMAARGDLFLELEQPGRILEATRTLLKMDAQAVAASRILSSLKRESTPTCEELSDLGFLAALGYRRLLLGDELAFHEKTLLRAVGTLESVLKYL